ncbi:DUF5050 domain-containing protein [Bacillus sp. JCM 19034]|uniref:DUF5050 domain-containing protein n=1 Tax=Bacillus sp. JCM 19034 TaxID=1481928 RepID=UPI0007832652|nr:DUF5050 domain-containing protein [Bacillus sp. JCM 19034]
MSKKNWWLSIVVMVLVVITVIGCSSNNDEVSGEIKQEGDLLSEEQVDQVDRVDEAVELEDEEEQPDVDEVQPEVVEESNEVYGNYNGNIFIGGRVDFYDEQFYIADDLGEGYGIYTVSVDGGEPNLVLEVGESSVKGLHVTPKGMFFVESNYEDDEQFQFYSFEDEEVITIAKGKIDSPQLADDKIWMMMIQTYPESQEGYYTYTLDTESFELERQPHSEAHVTVNNDYAVIQQEMFVYELEDNGEVGEEIEVFSIGRTILDGSTLYYNTDEGIHSYDLETGEIQRHTSEYAQYFNARNGHIFYSPYVEAEVDRTVKYASVEDGTDEILEDTMFYESYIFDRYMVAPYGRGATIYSIYDFETGEWDTLYHSHGE